MIEADPNGGVVVATDPDGSIVIGGSGADDIRVEGGISRVDGGGGDDRIHFSARTGLLNIAAGVPGSRSTLVVAPPYTLDDLRFVYLSGALYVELPLTAAEREGAESSNMAVVHGLGDGAPGVVRIEAGGRNLSVEQARQRARRR
jgi:hypothetical protein